jgi:hypothetical protein
VLCSFALPALCADEQSADTVDTEKDSSAPLVAFGYELGTPLPTAKVLSVDGFKHRIEPVIPYKIFSYYYAEITPDSRIIYSIAAQGELTGLRQAKDEFETLRTLLSEKYGPGVDQRTLNGRRYLEFTHAQGRVRLARHDRQVSLHYIDFEVMITANKEYQKRRDVIQEQYRLHQEQESLRDPQAL